MVGICDSNYAADSEHAHVEVRHDDATLPAGPQERRARCHRGGYMGRNQSRNWIFLVVRRGQRKIVPSMVENDIPEAVSDGRLVKRVVVNSDIPNPEMIKTVREKKMIHTPRLQVHLISCKRQARRGNGRRAGEMVLDSCRVNKASPREQSVSQQKNRISAHKHIEFTVRTIQWSLARSLSLALSVSFFLSFSFSPILFCLEYISAVCSLLDLRSSKEGTL